jgi:Flp pilus assembly protein TadG
MNNIKNAIQKTSRYRGIALVETALVMVLLLMFILGIMAFGWLFIRAQQITIAARNGARIAARYGATTSDVQTSVNNYLNSQGVVQGSGSPDIPTGINPGTGNPVTVTVKGKNLDILNLRNFPLIVDSFPNTFTASVTMAKEGP